MTLGGMIEADRRLRSYKFLAWREKKRRADEAVWRKWEGLVKEEEEEKRRRNKKKEGHR